MEFYQRLIEIMTCDAGNRGLHAPASDLEAVADALLSAEDVLVLTGFPVIGSDGNPHGETDGPAGAAEIACTLALLGSRVWLATDETAYPVLEAAAEVYGSDTGINVYGCRGEPLVLNDRPRGCIELVRIPLEGTGEFAEEFFAAHHITRFLSIERPGKGVCGHFCSTLSAHMESGSARRHSRKTSFILH